MSFTGDPIPSTPEAQFAAWRQEVERRLGALEHSPSLPYSSSKGGSVRFIDDVDSLVAYSGILTNGAVEWYQFKLSDTNNSSMFATRSDKKGIIQPDFQACFIPVTAVTEATTSGTFVTVFKLSPRKIYHNTLHIIVPFNNTGGATAEIRIRNAGEPAVQTNTLAVPTGQQLAMFEWLHGVPVGDDVTPSDPLFLIEVRRSNGAGTVTVFQPEESVWTSDALNPNADAAGNPRLL